MKRGEVRWCRFPHRDKKRPVVILTRDSIQQYLHEVTVVPISLTIRDIPSEIPLTPADGMPRHYAINFDHVQTISRERLGPLITTLGAQKMRSLQPALLFALGFGSE